MKHLGCLILLFLSNFVLAFDCALPTQLSNIVECSKSFRAKNIEELIEYMQDYKIDENGVAKNLLIDFDIDQENLNINSPCSIRIKKYRKVKSNGKVCIYGKNGLYINPYSNLSVKNLELYSDRKVAIRHHSTIIGDSLLLKSLKVGEESRVHIRHNSNITLNRLSLSAASRATLGHSSIYNVAETVSLETTGTPEQVFLREFSSIWKDTQISTKSLVLNSHRKVKISTGNIINAESISINSPQCVKHSSVPSISSCVSSITPRLRVSSRNIKQGENVVFNASKTVSQYGVKSFNYLIDNVIYENVGSKYTHVFDNPGVYQVILAIEDDLGNIVTQSKKITVDEITPNQELKANFYYLKESDSSVITVLVPRLGNTELKEAYYLFEDGGRVDLINKYYGSQKLLNIDGKEKVTLHIEDMEGNKSSVSHVIDMANLIPIVNLDIYHKNEKTFVFDINNSFDPLEDIDYVEIDYGDGAIEEFEDIDINTFQTLEHTYSRLGTFDGNLKYVSIRNGQEFVSNRQFTVDTGSEIDKTKIVRFKLAQDPYIKHVTINFDSSILVNNEVDNITWDYGDGTFSRETGEHIHFYSQGVYDVKLTVQFKDGTTKESTQRIVIFEDGSDLVSSIQCWDEGKLYVSCYSTIADKYGRLTNGTIKWGEENNELFSFLDGHYSPMDFEHSFESPGQKEVSLFVQNSMGETHISTTTIEVGSSDRYIDINCSSQNLNLNCTTVVAPLDAGNIKKIEYFINNELKPSDINGDLNIELSSYGVYQVFSRVVFNDDQVFDSEVKEVNIFEENLNPIANLTVDKVVIYKKESFNFLFTDVSDPEGELDRIVIDFGNGEEVVLNQAGIHNYSYQNEGSYTVSLTAFDRHGNNARAVLNLNVLANDPPIISVDCESSLVRNVRCTSTVFDEFQSFLKYHWHVDGIDVYSKDLDVDISSGGPKEITLIVEDNLEQRTQVTKSLIVKENTKPIINGDCTASSIPRQILCDLTVVDDGQIIESKISIAGEEYPFDTKVINLSSDRVYSIFTEVRDNYNEVTKRSWDITVVAVPEPEAKMNCTQIFTSNLIELACDLYSSSAYKGSYKNIHWESEGNISDKEAVVFNYPNVGEYHVALSFEDEFGNVVSETKSFNLGPNDKSIYKLSLIDDKKFFSKEERLRIRVDGAVDLQMADVQVHLNGNLIEKEISQNEVVLNLELLSGYNNLVVEGVDEFGKNFSQYFELLNGDAQLSLSLPSCLAEENPCSLSIFDVARKKEIYNKSLSESNLILYNVPRNKYLLFEYSNNNIRETRVVFIEEDFTTLEINDLGTSLLTETMLTNDIDETSYQKFKGSIQKTAEGLELVTDSNGFFHARKVISNNNFDEFKQFVQEVGFINPVDLEFYSFSIYEIGHTDIARNMGIGEDVNYETLLNPSYILRDNGKALVVDLIYKTKPPVNVSFFSKLFSAYADTQTKVVIKTEVLKKEPRVAAFAINEFLNDINVNGSEVSIAINKLDNIPEASKDINDYFSSYRPDFQMMIPGVSVGNLPEYLDKTSYDLKVAILSLEKFGAIDYKLEIGSKTFSIDQQNIDDRKYYKLLSFSIDNGDIASASGANLVIKTSAEKKYRIPVHFFNGSFVTSPMNFVSVESLGGNRYNTNRDKPYSGDDWLNTSSKSNFRSLLSVEGFKYDDISNLHGGIFDKHYGRCSKNQTLCMGSHKHGYDFDFLINSVLKSLSNGSGVVLNYENRENFVEEISLVRSSGVKKIKAHLSDRAKEILEPYCIDNRHLYAKGKTSLIEHDSKGHKDHLHGSFARFRKFSEPDLSLNVSSIDVSDVENGDKARVAFEIPDIEKIKETLEVFFLSYKDGNGINSLPFIIKGESKIVGNLLIVELPFNEIKNIGYFDIVVKVSKIDQCASKTFSRVLISPEAVREGDRYKLPFGRTLNVVFNGSSRKFLTSIDISSYITDSRDVILNGREIELTGADPQIYLKNITEKNVEFSVTPICDASLGQVLYESDNRCVFCPTGNSLRVDGSCDFKEPEPPVVENVEITPYPSCPTTKYDISETVVKNCSYQWTCKDAFGNKTITEGWFTGVAGTCLWSSVDNRYNFTEGVKSEKEVFCTNAEGEVSSTIKLVCE